MPLSIFLRWNHAILRGNLLRRRNLKQSADLGRPPDRQHLASLDVWSGVVAIILFSICIRL